ncbi:MAG: PfaD family polyunsaturated fatty acid/polyketide biosynthesis protein [Acidobacteriota bacterium]|nr:PfaD family polyunsaturated fatty acid/polyketide biosynthesis protein [Acidobacteriota bacterium]
MNVQARASILRIQPGRESVVGWWTPDGARAPEVGGDAVTRAVHHVASPVRLVDVDGQLAVAHGGTATLEAEGAEASGARRLVGYAPALRPNQLGDPGFCATHGLTYPYVAGAMANGVGSEAVVEAMARAGMVGFFGAAGLSPERIEAAIDRIQRTVGDRPYGFNLIHTPAEPQSEAAVVALYLRRGVHLVSAAAYLDLTLPLIRYRVAGIHRDAERAVVTPNKVIAKVSRVEVARKFFAPPPVELLTVLVAEGHINAGQADMAAEIPVAEDLTAEADSGGHTDNQPAISLVPTMLALADDMQTRHGYRTSLRVGAAGGIATPESVAAAFAMGAAFVLTGTINQSCVEAGTSPVVREMLARSSQADVTMAPAADMFEMGVQVQVLKWGTMFAVRARNLYRLYRTHASLDEIPAATRQVLERDYFRATLTEAWASTRAYFAVRDPAQVARAESDPKHRMALVFRSYLGQTSRWANSGEASRKGDYQIWCGPAIGAFNEWARGSFLEASERRDVVTLGMNLLVGAAALARVGWLRTQGVSLPRAARRFLPRDRADLAALVACE